MLACHRVPSAWYYRDRSLIGEKSWLHTLLMLIVAISTLSPNRHAKSEPTVPAILSLAAPSVLPSHVKIDTRDDGYWVALAPGATNTQKFLLVFDIPTASLNGHKLSGKSVQIVDGDKLKVGSRLLQLRIA